jgi:uncharacterized protein (UPF0303 family)
MEMKTNEELMKEAIALEEELQFPKFNNQMALDLGLLLVQRSKEQGHALTIDITKCGQQIFHYSFDGTLPDNDEWVKRKNRVVNRLHHSSFYFHCYLAQEGKTIDERYHISAYDFSPYGGAFPLIVKNTGVIGTITVSGLPQEEDHAFVVTGIRAYLDTLK